MESLNRNLLTSTSPKTVTRRELMRASTLAAATSGLAMPAIAQGISGEIAFATFEWTLPHTGSVLRKITQSFVKKYPNVTVREIPIPSSGYADQIFTQLTAGTPPDIFRIEDAQIALYMERGYLIPLDDALAQAQIDTSKFAAAAKDATRDGKTYGVVYQTNPRALNGDVPISVEIGRSSAAGLDVMLRRSAVQELV